MSELVVLSFDDSVPEPGSEEISKILADFAAKRWSEMVAASRGLTERYPVHEFGWRALGSALYMVGDMAGALAATERAVLLSPLSDSRTNLARLYFIQRQYLRAQEQCEAAILESPASTEAKKLLSKLNAILKKSDIGEGLRLAKARNEGTIAIQMRLANEEMNQARLPEALARLRFSLYLGLQVDWQEKIQPTPVNFDSKTNVRVFRQVLVSLALGGVQAFATSGTLLGLHREGRLLPHDKDLDIGVPLEQMGHAGNLLVAQGWIERQPPMSLINPRSFKHSSLNLHIDLFGFKVDAVVGKLISGFWSAKLPWSWQRITEYKAPLSLHKERHYFGEIWALDDPDTWLSAIYGDWQTPDNEFDAVISAPNLRGFSLLTESLALFRINKALLAGNLGKARSLLRQTRSQLPNDELLIRVEARLMTLKSAFDVPVSIG